MVKEEVRLYEEEEYAEKEKEYKYLKDRPVKSLTELQKLQVSSTLSHVWLEVPLLDPKYEDMYIATGPILATVFEQLGMAGDEPKDSATRARHWDCVLSEIKWWYKDKMNKVLKNYTLSVNIGKW